MEYSIFIQNMFTKRTWDKMLWYVINSDIRLQTYEKHNFN